MSLQRYAERGLALAAALWAWIGAAAPCHAQVLEIGDGGAVSVYDGPAVFTAEGAAPFPRPEPPAPAPGRARAGDPGVIVRAASAADLSPALVEAVAWRESGLRSGRVSRAGAVGEMQLMPATARWLGVDPRESRQNYNGGAAYLRVLMRRYDGDLERTLAAYDAGPTAVDRYGGVPPFKETQAYVAAILDRLSQQVIRIDPNKPPR